MKQKIKIILILSFCFLLKTEAQNLVPNPSFERTDTTICSLPSCYFTINYWSEFGSADVFNICDTSHTAQSVGVPKNFQGYQYAHSGNGYMGLIAYAHIGFDREYIEVPLISTLIIGHKYYVTFYVSLADTMNYAIENIGALFTDTLFNPFPMPPGTWVTGTPQIENPIGNMLNDKINWVPVSGTFIAQGGENYLTIGNFRDDAHTINSFLGGSTPNTQGAYYYIDDVYIGETPLGVEELNREEIKVEVYPNPSNGKIKIKSKKQLGTIIIYNSLGESIIHVSSKNNQEELDIIKLPAGIYFINTDSGYAKLVKE